MRRCWDAADSERSQTAARSQTQSSCCRSEKTIFRPRGIAQGAEDLRRVAVHLVAEEEGASLLDAFGIDLADVTGVKVT
jgi:hypothetical protein